MISNLIRYFQTYNYSLIILLGLYLFFALLQSQPISYTRTDEPYYYLQVIKWNETYPAIPGLGNLSVYFTYNSSILKVASLFSFSFLGYESFNDLNGWLY
ncbi:MAG: hypothetical protein AAFU64_10705, partial [Bacteroidota bacterium]